MPIPEKHLRFAVIVWVVTALLLGLTAQLASEHLWILAFVPLFLWALLGLVLLGMEGWRLRHRNQRRSAVAAILALVGAGAAFVPLADLGASLTIKARFALQRGRYEQVIARVRDSTPSRGYYESKGLTYFVEPGQPVRLAFPWPGGIIDNWCGAVYDPSKVVLQANKFTGDWDKWHDQVPIEVIRLFGGDMMYCAELEAPFYRCCFT
jgi:hypothetical protein